MWEKYTLRCRVDEIVSIAKRCGYEGHILVGLVHKYTLGTHSALVRMDRLVTYVAGERKRCCEHDQNLDRSAALGKK